jgi:type II secretory pathway pseudopilin PulG
MSDPCEDAGARRCDRCEAGLTLVELLVVVFLLALLAQAAVLASAGALEEGQQQVTQQTLGQLEVALLGQPQRIDAMGRPNFGGFVADIGGLPLHRGGDAAVALRELWVQPGVGEADGLRALPLFALQATTLDPEVRLACGWRGPYLRLGIGLAALRDGWAEAYRTVDAAGQATGPGAAIAGVVSLGADRAVAGTGYDADLAMLVEASSTQWSPQPVVARHHGAVPVQVQTLAAAGPVLVVRMYGPVDGTLGLLSQQHRDASSSNPFTPGANVLLEFGQMSIGPRVLRAYQTATVPALAAPVPSGARSVVQPVVVEPHAIQPVTLVIHP